MNVNIAFRAMQLMALILVAGTLTAVAQDASTMLDAKSLRIPPAASRPQTTRWS